MWRRGPMLPDTWGWGGIVPGITGGRVLSEPCIHLTGEYSNLDDVDEVKQILTYNGFYFASFKGDHVVAHAGANEVRYEADQIVCYDNSIVTPNHPKAFAIDPRTMSIDEIENFLSDMRHLLEQLNVRVAGR